MKLRGVLLVVLAIGALPGPSVADSLNHSLAEGQLLQQSCASQALALRAMCLGYLAAVADDVEHDQRAGQRSICIPALVNLDAFRLAFLGFLKDHPEQADRPSFGLVKAALAQAWPCG